MIIDKALLGEAKENSVCNLFFNAARFEKLKELPPTFCPSTKCHKGNGLSYLVGVALNFY
jgi:hypothetical protein